MLTYRKSSVPFNKLINPVNAGFFFAQKIRKIDAELDGIQLFFIPEIGERQTQQSHGQGKRKTLQQLLQYLK